MRFHFSTVVWGQWHTGVFLDANLPSLLATGNLPAFAAQHDVTYRIHTTPADAARIAASPSFRAANEIVPFEIIRCSLDNIREPIGMHHALWRRSIEEARKAAASILFVPPDVIWADGSLRHVAEHFTRGKRAVFMTYMRVVSETALPAVVGRYRKGGDAVLTASPRELVDIALEHIHPLTLTYRRDSANFPSHPEFILWPVPGEGFLMRVLVRELFAYDPSLIHLNERSLPAHALDPELVHFITDSDDLFSLSLAPVLKDVEWYIRPQQLDPVKVGSWWLAHDSLANDWAANHYFHVHRGQKTRENWRQLERQSDVLMRRIAGAREVLRVISALTDKNVQRVRQLLAQVLLETKLAEIVGPGGAATLLLPHNRAISRWNQAAGDILLATGTGRELIEAVLDHVILGDITLVPGRPAELRTAAGGQRALTWQGNIPLVDGVAILGDGVALSLSYRAHMVEAVLPPSIRSRSGRSWLRPPVWSESLSVSRRMAAPSHESTA